MATIRDIAKKAGVSVSTASRALNNNPRISQSTKEYIQRIARQFNYHPNYTAQNLSRGEANVVGLVFPVTKTNALANPFHIDLMRGISQALTPLHYQMEVALASSKKQLLADVISMVTQSKVHYFLLFYTAKKDPITTYLRRKKLRFVVIGHPANKDDCFVDNDNVKAGEAATFYLIEHQRSFCPAFIESKQRWLFEQDRECGFKIALTKKNLAGKVWPIVLQNDFLIKRLKYNKKVDGLVFADDLLFARFAREVRKYHLPIICFNNSRLLSGLLTKSEKRVDLQPQKLGKAAVEVLFSTKKSKLIDFKIS